MAGNLRYFDIIRQGSERWSAGQISWQELCAKRETPAEILVVFLPSEDTLIDLNLHNDLSSHFNIPDSFWDSSTRDASGFFTCQERRNGNGDLESFSSCFKFLIKQAYQSLVDIHGRGLPYTWYRLVFYTLWLSSNNVVVLCFDLPPSLKDLLSTSLMGSKIKLGLEDPFSFHSVLIKEISALFDRGLWSMRDLIRGLEKDRAFRPLVGGTQEEYDKMLTMHEVVRHVVHSSEMLEVAIQTMASMIQEHEIFFDENPDLPRAAIALSKQTRRALRSQSAIFKVLHIHSQSLIERHRNEMSLFLNSVAQHDSHIIARTSEAAQADSAAVKAISVLGLVFLPGAYTSAMFSTSFFNFAPGNDTEPQAWKVSEKFWVYWVVAIPMTLVTLACWTLWLAKKFRGSNASQS